MESYGARRARRDSFHPIGFPIETACEAADARPSRSPERPREARAPFLFPGEAAMTDDRACLYCPAPIPDDPRHRVCGACSSVLVNDVRSETYTDKDLVHMARTRDLRRELELRRRMRTEPDAPQAGRIPQPDVAMALWSERIWFEHRLAIAETIGAPLSSRSSTTPVFFRERPFGDGNGGAGGTAAGEAARGTEATTRTRAIEPTTGLARNLRDAEREPDDTPSAATNRADGLPIGTETDVRSGGDTAPDREGRSDPRTRDPTGSDGRRADTPTALPVRPRTERQGGTPPGGAGAADRGAWKIPAEGPCGGGPRTGSRPGDGTNPAVETTRGASDRGPGKRRNGDLGEEPCGDPPG